MRCSQKLTWGSLAVARLKQQKWVSKCWAFFFFLEREGDAGRGRSPSRFYTQGGAQHQTLSHNPEITTWTEIKSQTSADGATQAPCQCWAFKAHFLCSLQNSGHAEGLGDLIHWASGWTQLRSWSQVVSSNPALSSTPSMEPTLKWNEMKMKNKNLQTCLHISTSSCILLAEWPKGNVRFVFSIPGSQASVSYNTCKWLWGFSRDHFILFLLFYLFYFYSDLKFTCH